MTDFPVKIKHAIPHDPDDPARQGLAPNADPDDVLPLALAAAAEVIYQHDHGAPRDVSAAIERMREVVHGEIEAWSKQLLGALESHPAATPDPPLE